MGDTVGPLFYSPSPRKVPMTATLTPEDIKQKLAAIKSNKLDTEIVEVSDGYIPHTMGSSER